MTVRFGVHAGLQYTTTDALIRQWQRLDAAGFDWISVWDHFYAADLTDNPDSLEALTMHTALALRTERVRCGSLVYSVGYRHPAVLANAIATLDHLSQGRVTLGLGAGWLAKEYTVYGMPFPGNRTRLAQLEEYVQVVRLLLTEDEASFDGEHFHLVGARCEPKPAQARLPIWIGGGGERVTLGIVGRHADGWNVPYVSAEDWARKNAIVTRHAEVAGRDPASIERSVNIALAWDEADLATQFGMLQAVAAPSALTGSNQEIVDKVGAYVEAGADWVILAVRAPWEVADLERFMADIAPAFT